MVTFGLASVAQFKLEKQADKHPYSFISVNFGFGFGLTCAALVVGKISGLSTIDEKTISSFIHYVHLVLLFILLTN